VDEWIPLTADNFEGYYELLMARAYEHLEELGFSVRGP
jgi:hypothetical protein